MTTINSIFINSFFKVLSLLPVRLLRFIGKYLGSVLWHLNTRMRKVTEENLALCFPDMLPIERSALAKNSLQQLGMTLMELGPIWSRPVHKILPAISAVEGEQLLRQGVAEGRGVVVMVPHLGAWELLGLYMAEYYPLTSLYQPPDNPALDKLIFDARSRNGSNLAPTNTKGVKALLQALKRGEVVAILPDQVPPREGGDFADFFGIKALTSTLVRKIASRTGARIISGAALRIPGSGGFRVVFSEAPEEIYSGDQTVSLSAMNKSVEQSVLLAPEQYQWEYKRFKKRPQGEQKFYQNK